MINRGISAANGTTIWLTDADCLFHPDIVSRILDAVSDGHRLYFGERRHLSIEQTESLLAGRVDGLRQFEQLWNASQSSHADVYPWGYTQIFGRPLLESVRYRNDFDTFSHSDTCFIEDCYRSLIPFELVNGLGCLHMTHPFAWNGTDAFL
jgi:hypothetical protein